MPEIQIPNELRYIGLLLALFVIPKALQRWRLPSAVTAFLLGVGAHALGWFTHDDTVQLFATLGIVALFLTAGLEVELAAIRTQWRHLSRYLVVFGVLLVVAVLFATRAYGLGPRVSWLVALALLTPSTGFILASLSSFGLDREERFWVKNVGVAIEIVALLVLFVTLQSSSAQRLGTATLALAALIIVVPLLLRWFAGWIAPIAPNSEFAFLVILAVIAAYVTRSLGVYYLVGAFLVGVAAQAFRERLPAISSERMLEAVQAFGSLFAPFYFFNAGSHVPIEVFSPTAVALGLGFLVVIVPLRVGTLLLVRTESLRAAAKWTSGIGLALTPTLVFTLVIAEILRQEFGIGDTLFAALLLYTAGNTLVPGFVLRRPAAELDMFDTAAEPGHAPPGMPEVPPPHPAVPATHQ